MIAAIGPRALSLERYYIPVVVGVLYVFLIRIAVHVLQRVSGRPSTLAPLSVASMTVMLCTTILMSVESLSAPTEVGWKNL